MTEYQELPPPIDLANAVECLWTIQQTGVPKLKHRILPDGCADVIFSATPEGTSLRLAGAMTNFEDFPIASGAWMVGIRFRPGMWTSYFGVAGDELTNCVPKLEDLWGKKAGELSEHLASADCTEVAARCLARAFRPAPKRTAFQRTIGSLERNACQSLSEMADAAKLSQRQFRRVCLRETGLTPKLLMRILRFRQASTRLSSLVEGSARFALESGYADQSHLIAEFRHFSGRTPVKLLSHNHID